jgi:molybdopterin adenylyltransferase
VPKNWRAVVITCSDRAARGERKDQSGPAVQEILAAEGYQVIAARIVPDAIDAIADGIVRAVDQDRVQLVVTTGGTGISPDDLTPEATDRVTEKKIPGFGELMRSTSLNQTPMASLSRAQAAVRGTALIVNLPGSIHGATENLRAVLHLIPHALDLLAGKTDHKDERSERS